MCDEATSALDPQTTTAILQLLKSINQKLGITIVLITHEMEVVKRICDRVAVMSDGEIVELDNVLTVFSRPQTAVSKTLVRTNLHADLPTALAAKLASDQAHHPVLMLRFVGHAAGEPIIARLIREHDLSVNLLQGHIDTIQEQPIGFMIVEMRSDHQQTEKAIAQLEQAGVAVEVLGYVD